jgi:NAD(P)H-flavin reductase
LSLVNAEILEVRWMGVGRIRLRYPIKPLPGTFVSIISPGQWEIPLAVGDYWEGELELYVGSKKIFEWLSGRRRVTVKGPLGSPLPPMRRVLAFASPDHYYDLLYPLREVVRAGGRAKLVCPGCTEFDDHVDSHDGVLVSAHPSELEGMAFPLPAYLYVRWVKMNCMLGVCGVCSVGGKLACTSGPFMRVNSIEDIGKILH